MGLMRMMLMPLRMMKHMRMMCRPMMKGHMHKHKHGHMHMMWRSTMLMVMFAQLAMLAFIAVITIVSIVLPMLLFFAFLMKKWMKKKKHMGMHYKEMLGRHSKS